MSYLNMLKSIERVTISTIIYGSSLLINICVNAVLIFGLLGFPAATSFLPSPIAFPIMIAAAAAIPNPGLRGRTVSQFDLGCRCVPLRRGYPVRHDFRYDDYVVWVHGRGGDAGKNTRRRFPVPPERPAKMLLLFYFRNLNFFKLIHETPIPFRLRQEYAGTGRRETVLTG